MHFLIHVHSHASCYKIILLSLSYTCFQHHITFIPHKNITWNPLHIIKLAKQISFLNLINIPIKSCLILISINHTLKFIKTHLNIIESIGKILKIHAIIKYHWLELKQTYHSGVTTHFFFIQHTKGVIAVAMLQSQHMVHSP